MNPPVGKNLRGGKLRGRRCVRCGKKLEGYRRIFCGAECRREDNREKKQSKRAGARGVAICPLCGRRTSLKVPRVNVDTAPSSHDRRGSGGEGAGRKKRRGREARGQGGKEAKKQGSKEAGNGFTAEAYRTAGRRRGRREREGFRPDTKKPAPFQR